MLNFRRESRIPSFYHRSFLARFAPGAIAAPALIAWAAGAAWISAFNTPPAAAAPAPPEAAPAAPLPLKDVVLFTSGVGYFQRAGTLDGAAAIPLSFRTTHIDDVLKSLILIDPDGHVEPATYTSQEPISRVLQSFGLDVSQNLTMANLLEQLRGVRVQITTRPPDPQTIEGQVLSVETHSRRIKVEDGSYGTEDVSTLNLLTDTGIRSVPLSQVGDMQILDPTLAQQLKQSLNVLATDRDAQQRTVTLHFGAGPARQVEVGYVTEAPVWKTSYRLSVSDTEKPYMQGWALVDNPSDQDWDNVRLTLVSGQPISFIEDLYTPLYLTRPVVPPEVQANPYPQLSEDNLLENAKQAAQHAAETPPPSPVYTTAAPAPMAGGIGGFGGGGGYPGGSGGYPGLGAAAARKASPASSPAANDRNGAVDETLVGATVAAAAAGGKAGELFQYRIKTPVTVPRRQSAMIPIVSDAVSAGKIDLYDADVNLQNPENALELKNTTGLHLKAGPVTIFDGQSYAGDGRMPEVETGDTQIITYAVDLGITGSREYPDPISHLASLSIRHGVLILTTKEQRTTKYTFKSKLDRDRVLLVEQPIRATGDSSDSSEGGWKLLTPEKPDQKTQNYYRFRLTVPGGSSTPFKVTENRVDTQTVGLLDADINTLLQYRQNALASPALQAALGDISGRKQRIDSLNNQLAAQKARLTAISNEQARIRLNMDRLDRNSALYKRYVTELDDQETELGKIRTESDRLQTELLQAKQDLSDAVGKLDVE